MSLRIACDLDGTVADMSAALQRESERLFGPGVALFASPGRDNGGGESRDTARDTPRAPDDVRMLSPRQVRTLWSHVRKIENFWETLDEIEPGSLERFWALSAAHRWHVLFMTKRPQTRGESAQMQSHRWLQERGFLLPSVCVVAHSRGVIAGTLGFDAVIDDRPETCLDVAADSKATPLLVWRGPLAAPPGVAGLGVNIVGSFHEALDRLEDLATAARRPGFVERIRSALRPPT